MSHSNAATNRVDLMKFNENRVGAEWKCPVCTSRARVVSITGGNIDHLYYCLYNSNKVIFP